MEDKNKNPKFSDMFKQLLDDHIGREEFADEFEKVVERVEKIDARTASDVEALANTLRAMVDELKTTTNSDVSAFKQELRRVFKEASNTSLATINAKLDEVDMRLADLHDGKDADEETIVGQVLSRIVIPEVREPLMDTPQETRDKLERLQGDDRIDKSAIKGIEELEQEIARVASRPTGGGLSQMALQHALGKLLKHEHFSTSSATTTITLANKVAGDVVIWLRYNGQMLTYGQQYTVSKSIVTFTFTLDDLSEVEVTYLSS